MTQRRMRLGRPSRRLFEGVGAALGVAGSAACLLALSPPASADLLKDVGRFLGRPLGGFVEAATVPTVQQVEGSAHRILSDVDVRLQSRVNQAWFAGESLIGAADRVARERVAQVDAAAAARLSQADGIMAARIAQVDASADARLAQALGGLSQLERQAVRDAQKLVTGVDAAAAARIRQVDDAVNARIAQVRGSVETAIAQADEAARGRIEQLDEVAERRLGSVDVIASKLSLSLQVTLLKVGALLGMVAFLVFALRHLFSYVPKALELAKQSHPGWGSARRGALVSAGSLGWLLVHVVAGAAGVGVFAVLAHRLPVGAREEAAELVRVHRAGLDGSYSALDFSRVRYHVAQLGLLDTEHMLADRALERRADLIRTAFARPGLLASPEGVRELTRKIAEAEGFDRRADPERGVSPDVLAVTCYLEWQLARTRLGELDAVTACARALEAPAGAAPFSLRPLAAAYVRLFLAREPAAYEVSERRPYSPEALSALAAAQPADERFVPLAAAAQYDELVLALDRASSNAYVALLEAHAELMAAVGALPPRAKVPAYAARPAALDAAAQRVLDGKRQRLERARDVIAAWRTFDTQLDASPELGGSPLTLSVLTLNDAPLSHALWFEAHPDALTPAPSLADEKSSAARLGMAPIRIAWARRYLVALSPDVQALVGYEESERFARHERATLDFQRAFVEYRLAERSGGAPRADLTALRDAAALAAGALGIYTTGPEQRPIGLGLRLLAAPNAPASATDIAPAVRAAYDGARLRLL